MTQLGQYPDPTHVVAHLSDPHLLAAGQLQYGVVDPERGLVAALERLGLIDRAYIAHSGRILTEGTPEQIVANEDARRLYLGEDFRL